mgnify:CR=1 FL=1
MLGETSPVVIVHGTDTMVQTGLYLKKSPNLLLKVPIVLTGAMTPLGFEGSDGLQNLTESLFAVRILDPGIYVVMHNQVFPQIACGKDREYIPLCLDRLNPISMLTAESINTLFDAELPEPSHWESSYPPRDLPPGAIVTRFAPSPTGFLHTGGVYTANLGKNLARPFRGFLLYSNRRHRPGSRSPRFARTVCTRIQLLRHRVRRERLEFKVGTVRTVKARADLSHLRARVAAERPRLSVFLHS